MVQTLSLIIKFLTKKYVEVPKKLKNITPEKKLRKCGCLLMSQTNPAKVERTNMKTKTNTPSDKATESEHQV